jgi:hypothetical protein
MNMRCVIGRVGTATSRVPCWRMPGSLISGARRGGKKEAVELAELTVPEVCRLLDIALPLPPQSTALRLTWSRWRRAKRLQARRSHYKRRGETLPVVIGYRSMPP